MLIENTGYSTSYEEKGSPMEYIYETIEHNHHIPIKIFTQTIDKFPYHWHEDTEILFVLKGEVEITIENEVRHLYEGNVFLVNSDALHYIEAVTSSGQAKLLVMQFDINHFNQYNMDAVGLKFSLDYVEEGAETRKAYDQVRGILASIMRVVINEEEPKQLLVERHLMDLMIVLIGNFKLTIDPVKDVHSNDDRIMEILKYIGHNCEDQRMNLDRIAEFFHLSPQYLSRYFKAQVGVSMKKFIDNVRMNKSLQALKVSDDRIIDIALKYGFPDAKAYYRVFKETMGTTPADYREQNRVEEKPKAVADYFSINSSESLAKLFEFIGDYQYQFTESQTTEKHRSIDMRTDLGSMPRNACKLMTFGYAPHGLMTAMDDQFTIIQKSIGFEYVRFHGIFSDDMMVYNIDDHGKVYYNFTYTDQLIDRLLNHGLKPFLELGFMPSALASGDRTIFEYKLNVTPPKDLDQWCALIDAFVRHLLNRYGTKEVRSWYFEFWNEPEFNAFFDGTFDEFYELFKSSFDTIKAIDKAIRVGGFGTILFKHDKSWLNRYTERAKEDNLLIDFFSFHVYQVDVYEDLLETEIMIEILENPSEILDKVQSVGKREITANNDALHQGDASFIINEIKGMVNEVSTRQFSKDEYFITEWNSSTDGQDLVHDTCYMAAYIVKNVLASLDQVDGFGFWTASDIFEEFNYDKPLFHGGYGLMTKNGIKKAAFYGFEFLSQLGDTIVWQSEDGIMTRSGDDYQLLLFNYCHYNDLYKNFDYSQISQTKRYDVFKQQVSRNVKLKLKNIKGTYRVERRWVNRSNGSAYDVWERSGAPEDITDQALDFIRAGAEPGYRCDTIDVDNHWTCAVTLEPHEIQLIKLQKIY